MQGSHAAKAWPGEWEAGVADEIAIVRFRELNRLAGCKSVLPRQLPSARNSLGEIAVAMGPLIEGQVHGIAGGEIMPQIVGRQFPGQFGVENVG